MPLRSVEGWNVSLLEKLPSKYVTNEPIQDGNDEESVNDFGTLQHRGQRCCTCK